MHTICLQSSRVHLVYSELGLKHSNMRIITTRLLISDDSCLYLLWYLLATSENLHVDGVAPAKPIILLCFVNKEL